MKLQDFADQLVLFASEGDNKGELTCRICGKHIHIILSLKRFLFLTASRVSFDGDWCVHSNLRQEINHILVSSMNRIENESLF